MILAVVLCVYLVGLLLFWLALSSLSSHEVMADEHGVLHPAPLLPLLPTLVLVLLWPLALVVACGMVAWTCVQAWRDVPC